MAENEVRIGVVGDRWSDCRSSARDSGVGLRIAVAACTGTLSRASRRHLRQCDPYGGRPAGGRQTDRRIVTIPIERSLTRHGERSLRVFTALAISAAVIATVVARADARAARFDRRCLRPSTNRRLPEDAAPADRHRGLRSGSADLVPANPVRAAADGAMLPLIVSTLGFGVALTKLAASGATTVIGFFGGLADAMMALGRMGDGAGTYRRVRARRTSRGPNGLQRCRRAAGVHRACRAPHG